MGAGPPTECTAERLAISKDAFSISWYGRLRGKTSRLVLGKEDSVWGAVPALRLPVQLFNDWKMDLIRVPCFRSPKTFGALGMQTTNKRHVISTWMIRDNGDRSYVTSSELRYLTTASTRTMAMAQALNARKHQESARAQSRVKEIRTASRLRKRWRRQTFACVTYAATIPPSVAALG